MLESFLSYLKFERRASPNTFLSYKKDLEQFQDYLDFTNQGILISSASYSHIRGWIITLVDQGIVPRSINRKIASLRAFYKFLLKREVLSTDPTLKVRLLKTKKQLPHFVEESDMVEILESEISDGSEFVTTRNKLILELFYGTGIRLAELVGLKKSNLFLYESVIKVTGKRNKERIIPINHTLFSLIKEYLELKEKEFPLVQHDFFIVTNKGTPAYSKLIYRVVNRKLTMVQNLDKRSPHVLRHTFATHLLDKGADLNAIKELLGHTSLAATQVYTHNSLEKLKAIFNQAHPKA